MTLRTRIPTLLVTVLAAGALMAAGAYTQEAKEGAKEPAKAEVPAGQQVFLKYKCNSCHTLEAAKVVKVEDEDEAKDSSTKRKPPDLSGVGKKHNAAWMEKYLTKKEMIDGERHSKKFRGADEELKAVTAWLETFKVEAKKAKKS